MASRHAELTSLMSTYLTRSHWLHWIIISHQWKHIWSYAWFINLRNYVMYAYWCFNSLRPGELWSLVMHIFTVCVNELRHVTVSINGMSPRWYPAKRPFGSIPSTCPVPWHYQNHSSDKELPKSVTFKLWAIISPLGISMSTHLRLSDVYMH